MKIVSMLALMFTTNVMASSAAKYRPKKMNCSELQDTIENYRSITVNYGLLDISYFRVYASSENAVCDSSYSPYPQPAYFKTKDKVFCRAGYTCVKRDR